MMGISRLTRVALIVAFSLAGVSVNAAGPYKTSKPRPGKFTVEYVYNYTSRKYTPPIRIDYVKRDQVSRVTPEDASIAHFSAMAARDYDWWLSGWNPVSRSTLESRDRDKKRTPGDWQTLWEGAMKDMTVMLLEKVETGPYVFMVYDLRDRQGKTAMHSIYALRKDGDNWLGTVELAEDLMFHHYTKGTPKVRLNVR